MKKIKSKTKRIKRRKIINGIFIIPIIILTLIASNTVRAGTQDSTLVRNQVDGIYAVAPLSDGTHLYNLEMYQVNNRVAYCIEIGKKVTTTIYNSTSNLEEQQKLTNLSQNQLNYIKLIAYFGYGYKGHDDYRYYMAAQELIWEYLNNINIKWTNTLDINGPEINITAYKNRIKEQISQYIEEFSFDSNIKCKVGETIVLTDTNKSLSYYTITSSGNQTVAISGNNLTINISGTFIGKDKITLTRENNYGYSSNVYYVDSSQSLISVGDIATVAKTITLDVTGEKLTTSLIDQDTQTNIPTGQATLSGAVYEIYDKNNNLISTFTTDDTGINTIPNLYHETYYIKQIKPSKGYKLNDEIIEINLTSKNNTLTLVEEAIKSTIEINKLYELGDNYQREENIKFEFYDNQDKLYSSITTTKLGPDKITLPYGVYTIKQVNTTYSYDKVKDINLIIDENSDVLIRYDLVDKKITSKIHITTKDGKLATNINAANVKYKIKDKITNEYLTYIDANNDKVNEFSTNNSGELTIPISLPYGIYIIEQTSTPWNYLENKEPLEITINDESIYSYINDEIVINVDFFNELITGKINVTTNKEIFDISDNNYNTKIEIRSNIELELYLNDKLIDTYQTNEEGYLEITDLKLGSYCIKEKESSNQKCLELTNLDNKTAIIEKSIELTEKLQTTNVILNNIDTNQEPIKGTTIELTKDDKLINTSITNEDGVIKINSLPKGTYCFKETKISSQYILNEKKLCFDIKDTSKNINLSIINDLNNKVITIPNTLSNNKYYFLMIPFLLIIGAIIYKKKKYNNHH